MPRPSEKRTEKPVLQPGQKPDFLLASPPAPFSLLGCVFWLVKKLQVEGGVESMELTVQATHFGTLALVIIGAALGVFVLTSIRRALTRGRGDQAGSGGADPDGADNGADTPDPPAVTERADNVVTDRADDKHPPEDPDEYASAPGRTDSR